jgi:hypothetical protein
VQIQIDRNKPLPVRGGGTKYPFSEMNVGDSFFSTANRYAVLSCFNNWTRGNTDRAKFKIVTRKEGDGFRFWLSTAAS